MSRLPLDGLVAAPAQVWGRVRLIPLLRPECPGDLRMDLRRHALHFLDVVHLGNGQYWSYIPHALVARWSDDGVAAVAATTVARGKPTLVLEHRFMRRKESPHALRMLPLHLAMEGFLAKWIGGPEVIWAGWTRRAKRRGFSPRVEWSVTGRAVPDLGEALRLFEIVPDQVGVVVLVDDRVASVNVYAHPDDYRALHRSLIEDFFGVMFRNLGPAAGTLPVLEAPLTGAPRSLGELRELASNHRAWLADTAMTMVAPWFRTELELEVVYELGPFRLARFLAADAPVPFVGECILRADGTLGYLKTYNLDRDAVRRVELLRCFARHEWSPEATAAARGLSLWELRQELERLGLPGVLEPPPREGGYR